MKRFTVLKDEPSRGWTKGQTVQLSDTDARQWTENGTLQDAEGGSTAGAGGVERVGTQSADDPGNPAGDSRNMRREGGGSDVG